LTVRLAGIPITEIPAPLGWARPALLACAPRGGQDHGSEAEFLGGGWPALARPRRRGRPVPVRAARFGLLLNPHLLLTPPHPRSAAAIIESVEFGYTAALQKCRS